MLSAENILIRELEGESVLLNLATESYFGLDDVGTRMWMVLTTSGSVQEAYELLLDEYEVAPDALRNDLAAFVEELASEGSCATGEDEVLT